MSRPNISREDLERQILVMILMAIEEKFDVYVPVDGQITEAKDLKSFIASIADHILQHD